MVLPILILAAVLAAYLALLLLALRAFPGRAAFWKSVAMLACLLAVPEILVSADGNWHSWARVGFSHHGILDTVITTNAMPIAILYDVLLAAGALFMAWRYYPAVRGWRLLLYWVLTVVLLMGVLSVLQF